MDAVVDKIIDIVRKNKVKIITITESNHRSYTSHTFHYELVKKLYENKLIDTFGSERMGIIDADIINWYIENKKKVPKNIIEKIPFGGLGYSRIINYLSKKPRDSYEIVGLEEDNYCIDAFSKLPKNFDLLSESFLKQIREGAPIQSLTPETSNDKKWLRSLKSFKRDHRETFWLNEITKVLKRRKTIFINGYHLGKNDKIGKWLLKNYNESEILFLGMGAKNVTAQVLIIPSNKRNFNLAVINGDYTQKVMNIDSICAPTSLEKETKEDEWRLVKVNPENETKKIRTIGCYLAIYEKDYLAGNKVYIGYEIKKYNYVILFDKSVYKEKMFY